MSALPTVLPVLVMIRRAGGPWARRSLGASRQGGAREHNGIENIIGDTMAGREVVDGIEGAFVMAAAYLICSGVQ